MNIYEFGVNEGLVLDDRYEIHVLEVCEPERIARVGIVDRRGDVPYTEQYIHLSDPGNLPEPPVDGDDETPPKIDPPRHSSRRDL